MRRRCEPCADPDGCPEVAVRGSYCAAHAALYLVAPGPLRLSASRIEHMDQSGSYAHLGGGGAAGLAMSEDRVRAHVRWHQRTKPAGWN